MKLVLNKSYGSFCLSREAVQFMAERGDSGAGLVLDTLRRLESNGDDPYSRGLLVRTKNRLYHACARNNPLLLAAIDALGQQASGDGTKLAVVEVPTNEFGWYVRQVDGGCEQVVLNSHGVNLIPEHS